MDVARPTRRPLVLAVAALLIVGVAVAGGVWWRSDAQVQRRFVSSLEDMSGVSRVTPVEGYDSTLRVRMDPRASETQVVAVARKSRDEGCCLLYLLQGRATLTLRNQPDTGLRTSATLLTHLGRADIDGSVDVPRTGDGSVVVSTTSGSTPAQQMTSVAAVLRAFDGVPDEAATTVKTVYSTSTADGTGASIDQPWAADLRARAVRLLEAAASADPAARAGHLVGEDSRGPGDHRHA